MTKDLIEIMLNEGMKIDDYADTWESIAEAVALGQIKAIMRWGHVIGFYSWKSVIREGKLYIFINNMCILRNYRNPTNLLFLRRWFRYKYPQAKIYYWYNRKKERFYYGSGI